MYSGTDSCEFSPAYWGFQDRFARREGRGGRAGCRRGGGRRRSARGPGELGPAAIQARDRVGSGGVKDEGEGVSMFVSGWGWAGIGAPHLGEVEDEGEEVQSQE